jgi:hypothetical protein
MTASMWDTQVAMMEVKIQAAGMPPLTSEERESILEYLKRRHRITVARPLRSDVYH